MRRTFSDRIVPILVGVLVAVPLAADAQDPPAEAILSSDISLSRDAAQLRLELRGGETLVVALGSDGSIQMDGEAIGRYERRDALDQSWRDLLQRAMDAPAGSLPSLLMDWEPPADAGERGDRLDAGLEVALATAVTDAEAQESMEPANMSDSVGRLNERIRELERVLEDPNLDADELANLPLLQDLRQDLEREIRDEVRNELRGEFENANWMDRWNRPWRHITRGIAGVFSTLMAYAILVGIGFLVVFFGRQYLERIADTAREAPLRSGLVGLAGGFLVLPGFILGTLALAISIVGIPLLLVWLPGFWVALVLAGLGGFLAVAHGAGEAFAERRFTASEWFTRANSYYYIVTGVGLLLVLYIAANVVSMAGPFLGFLEGMLRFMAVMVSIIAGLIGFGAVLISRGGTRPTETPGLSTEPDLEEEQRV